MFKQLIASLTIMLGCTAVSGCVMADGGGHRHYAPASDKHHRSAPSASHHMGPPPAQDSAFQHMGPPPAPGSAAQHMGLPPANGIHRR